MNPERRTPEELLITIKREERQKNKGRLKIFLGMSAGVGKTYAMLEEAQELRKSGIEVYVGVIDTHDRHDTAALLNGLNIIPERIVNYKGKEFKELDVDAIIRIKPYLVLIDELAHSNIPGLRHAKRWQDVMEILDHGINVYTTLNVQHIDSLNDIVETITEAHVRETVPDLMIENADSIQLIDITPDELIQRLREGKVYFGSQSRIAPLHFFQKDKLTALREIVLRYAAEKIDRDLQNTLPTSTNVFEWKPREKLLVAISHSPHSQKLIRATRRIAAAINAPWIAAYVDSGKTLNEEDRTQLTQNLQLARDLGAEIVTIIDPDIAEGIQRICRQKGITQIILGRTPTRPFVDLFKRNTLLEKISSECPDIDVHVIRQERLSVKYRKKNFNFPQHTALIQYVFVFLFICLLAGINFMFLPVIGYKIIGAIFLIGLLFISLFFKRGPILFAVALYALIWSIFFIPPLNQFDIDSYEDLALLILYSFTALAIGILVNRSREHQEMLIKSEESVRSLYDIVQLIASASSPSDIIKEVKDQLKKKFAGEFEVLVKQIDDGLLLDKPINLLDNEEEKAAALWVFENGKEAGWSTNTLPLAKNFYIPLKNFQEVLGILVYRPKENKFLSHEENIYLYTVCRQLASYFERLFSEERTKQSEQKKQMENIHTTILNRLSQEFERPLKIGKNAIETWKHKTQENKEVRDVEKSFDVFIKILSNISSMAQLSQGSIQPNPSLHNIRNIIEECCKNIKKIKNDHIIKIKIEDELPLVSFDYYLIYLLLNNLIINAFEYSPSASTVEIEAKTSGRFLVLSVADEGKGIPEDQLESIFEKFYRLPEATTSPGAGLGLAIAKAIAEAHDGYLQVENLPEKGAKFSFYLPMENTPAKTAEAQML